MTYCCALKHFCAILHVFFVVDGDGRKTKETIIVQVQNFCVYRRYEDKKQCEMHKRVEKRLPKKRENCFKMTTKMSTRETWKTNSEKDLKAIFCPCFCFLTNVALMMHCLDELKISKKRN